MSDFVDKMKRQGVEALGSRTTSSREPLWKGPEEDGVTFSLLSKFLVCRERFRVVVIDGLKPAKTFNHRVSYGNLWHVCEESLAQRGHNKWAWQETHLALLAYCKELAIEHPTQAEQVDHWYNVCKVQFPIYVDFWAKHKDVTERTPLLQEQVFDVPYTLPSGRKVRLRGKWDSVDLIGKGKAAGIYLQENKTKGDINEPQMKQQLSFDLQTMMYMVSLEQQRVQMRDDLSALITGKNTIYHEKYIKEYGLTDLTQDILLEPKLVPLLGVRYNVIRRPLSGGKGTIVRHKPSKANPAGESKAAYYARLAEYIRDEPASYFMRWKVEIPAADITRFREECFNPILEQLCNWWGWVTSRSARPDGISMSLFNDPDGIHWRAPYGCYNSLLEGGSTDLDEYLLSGSHIGLEQVDDLFPELTEVEKPT